MFSQSPHDGGGKRSHRSPTFSPNYQLDRLVHNSSSPGTASPHLAAHEDDHAADATIHDGDSDEGGLLTQPPDLGLHNMENITKRRRLSLTHPFEVGITSPTTTSPSYEQSRHHESSSYSSDGFLTQPPEQAAIPNPNLFILSHERTPQFLPKLQIPQPNIDIITACTRSIHPTINMRDFQVEAINHLAFEDDSELILIRRTADGKSLVPHVTSALRRGISIILVPLHGLGSDQVEHNISEDNNIEAYYVDEHRKENATALRNRLLHFTMEESQHTSIMLFVSPQSLLRKSFFYPVYRALAKRQLIRLLAIDEAHAVEQSGRSFRVEFIEAMNNLSDLHSLSPTPIPRLAMSATFREDDRVRLQSFFQRDDVHIMQGPLERRATKFVCLVSGDPVKTMMKSAETDLKCFPNNQQLWYGNSRSNCEGALLDKGNQLIEKHVSRTGDRAVCHSFTGGDGLKMKTPIMEAFTSFSTLQGDASINPDGSVTLPRILILTATSAANCGINSNDLRNVKHKGFPYNLYDVVQEMGRANRTQLMSDCKYELHVSFDCFVSSYIRIMANVDAAERVIAYSRLLEVVQFLMTPVMCYHSYVETYFEWTLGCKQPCLSMCSYCNDDCNKVTGLLYRSQLTSLISQLFQTKQQLTASELKRAIKERKALIWHRDSAPKASMKPIHALLLQLVATQIIRPIISESLLGSNGMKGDDVGFVLSYSMNRHGVHLPTYVQDEPWRFFALATEFNNS